MEVLTAPVENVLHLSRSNTRLSIIVVDFLVSKHKSDQWHKDKILKLMQIVERHPKGNIIRFGLLFYTPDLVKPREITANLNLRHNFLHLFEKINRFNSKKILQGLIRAHFGNDWTN